MAVFEVQMQEEEKNDRETLFVDKVATNGTEVVVLTNSRCRGITGKSYNNEGASRKTLVKTVKKRDSDEPSEIRFGCPENIQ